MSGRDDIAEQLLAAHPTRTGHYAVALEEIRHKAAARIRTLAAENKRLLAFEEATKACSEDGTESLRELAAEILAARGAKTELKTFHAAFGRSPYDISPCMTCGEPVVCLPDGAPMCDPCGEKSE